MVFNFFLPQINLFFGRGALENIGEEAKKLGRSALLVTGKSSMARLGFLDETIDYLQKAGIDVTHFDKVIPNPTTELVDEGAKLALENDCNLVVALGGGSSIDVAKTIAVVVGHSTEEFHSIWEFSPSHDSPKAITSKTLPIIAVTSTSGTGSHLSRFSVITNPWLKEKVGIRSEYIFPKVSIVDVNILKGMPPALTAECGVDVLTHCLEGLISKQSNPMSEELALKGIELVFDHLPKAYRDGDNLKSREGMALADTYAGLVITTSRVTLTHALSHPISAYYPDISHGAALAALTPAGMEFNIAGGDENTLQKFCLAAGAMGKKVYGTSEEEAMKSVEGVRELLSKIDMDMSLMDLGVEPKRIREIVNSAFKSCKGPLLANPVEVNERDLTRVLKASVQQKISKR